MRFDWPLRHRPLVYDARLIMIQSLLNIRHWKSTEIYIILFDVGSNQIISLILSKLWMTNSVVEMTYQMKCSLCQRHTYSVSFCRNSLLWLVDLYHSQQWQQPTVSISPVWEAGNEKRRLWKSNFIWYLFVEWVNFKVFNFVNN